MRNIPSLVILLTVCLTAVSFSVRAAEDCAPPNIIVFLADDLGYGDLGCYGSTENTTPNLDQLAEQGMRFTEFYASSWCAPSRCALMTGCYPNRPGLLKNHGGRLAKRVTMAEMLREHGYRTALIGKWHLGMGEGVHPLDQGFDYWYGTEKSNDADGPRALRSTLKNKPETAWKTPIYKNREKHEICPQSQFTRRYTEETIRLIEDAGERPFFIYLAHNMPHVPVFASDAFKGKSGNGVYGDVLMELDWSMGEIQKALKKAGVDRQTLIIFASDNGPWSTFSEYGGVAWPLRGEKATAWEGGVRVPAIAYWPGRIKPATNTELIYIADLYATVASLVGTEVEEGEAMDSHDMSAVLLSDGKSLRQEHIYYFGQPMAYRKGEYKLHFKTRDRLRDPDTAKIEPSVACDPPMLFNISNDPGESVDIASAHPDIVKELTAEFKAAKAAIRDWKPLHTTD